MGYSIDFVQKKKKLPVRPIAALLVLLVSVFVLSPIFSNPDTWQRSMAVLEKREGQIVGLTAATTGISLLITALPDDIGTPIADEVVDLADYLLIAMVAILVEKYLLTLSGYLCFTWILPGALLLFGMGGRHNNHRLCRTAIAIVLFVFIIAGLVPVSIQLTGIIDDTYEQKVQGLIDQGGAILEAYAEEEASAEGDGNENQGTFITRAWESVSGFVSSAVSSVGDVVTTIGQVGNILGWAKDALSAMFEVVAVSIVTSIVMPILILIVMIFLAKLLFNLLAGIWKEPASM